MHLFLPSRKVDDEVTVLILTNLSQFSLISGNNSILIARILRSTAGDDQINKFIKQFATLELIEKNWRDFPQKPSNGHLTFALFSPINTGMCGINTNLVR
jgi:hypothetical protein